MAFYRTIALASFAVILVLMTERSNTQNHGGIHRTGESCNQTCRVNDDDSTTACPPQCICQATRGWGALPQYGQGQCVKA
uniref:8 kDa Amblyomma family member n=1 Tax=Rhipicephalus zambeziensis TaxID=60191 RepID=A0A224Y7Q8_9ACAR